MFKNKRVFITGAASGLGRALAMEYAGKGFRLAIGDIDRDNLALTKAALLKVTDRVIALPCNTCDLQDVENACREILETWGGLDIVINNAGIAGAVGTVEQLEERDWQKVFDVNFFGVVNGCKVFSELFKKQKSGAIVNIASMADLLTPPGMGPYNTSKSAVISLSETLKYELAPFDISVHVVCPGFFKTNLTSSMQSSDKAKSFVNKRMDKSSLSSGDIAAMIARQVDNGELFLLPHAQERNMWRFKRLFPNLFLKKAIKTFSETIRKKAL